MLGKLEFIEIGEKRYPLAFSFNVMEQVQETYGSMNEWMQTLSPVDGNEVRMKDLIWTFQQFVNEGIEIDNDERSLNNPLLTHKQIGRLITSVDMGVLVSTMKNLTIKSMKNENPNVNTTQNQMNQ